MDDHWKKVIDFIENNKRITLGNYCSYWWYKTPRRFLHALSYYKFAAKVIGENKKVLDVGCNEGVGTYLLAKECGFAKGVDFDPQAIRVAKRNFSNECVEFTLKDFLKDSPKKTFDAVTSFDVIEHILYENEDRFLQQVCKNLKKRGVFILGTPNKISQKFASNISKKGHINMYSPERLEAILRKYFTFVFLFAANDEIVHTGFLPLAHYLIAVCCKKRGC